MTSENITIDRTIGKSGSKRAQVSMQYKKFIGRKISFILFCIMNMLNRLWRTCSA